MAAPAAQDFHGAISGTVTDPKGARLQLRVEAINALNYSVYWDPDTNPRSSPFGLFRSLRNNPRDVPIGLRFNF